MNKLIVILLAGIFSVVSFSAFADHTPEHTQAAAASKPAKAEIKKHQINAKKEKHEKKAKVVKEMEAKPEVESEAK
jgi:ABC-type transporter MlaC component